MSCAKFAVPEEVFGEKSGGKKTNSGGTSSIGSLFIADSFGKAEDWLGLDVIGYLWGFVHLFI